MSFDESKIDEIKFTKNYSKIAEDLIQFYISERKIYKSFENIIIIMSVANRLNQFLVEAINSSDTNTEVFTKINLLLKEKNFKGVNASSIVRETGIPRTTVIRICDQLVKKSILSKTENGGFSIGPKFREFNKDARVNIVKFFESIKNKYE